MANPENNGQNQVKAHGYNQTGRDQNNGKNRSNGKHYNNRRNGHYQNRQHDNNVRQSGQNNNFVKKQKSLDTVEDLQQDISKIEKEIQLEINSIKSMKVNLLG